MSGDMATVNLIETGIGYPPKQEQSDSPAGFCAFCYRMGYDLPDIGNRDLIPATTSVLATEVPNWFLKVMYGSAAEIVQLLYSPERDTIFPPIELCAFCPEDLVQ